MNENRKRVLFLIGHISGGGAERVACELSLSLEQYYDTSMAVYEDRPTSYMHTDNYYCINISRANGVISKAINLVRKTLEIRKLKKKLNIHVCISFMDDSNYINVLSGHCKTICSIRSVMSANKQGRIIKLIERLILNSANKVVTLSDYVKNDLVSQFHVNRDNIVTIYNPCSFNSKDKKDHIELKHRAACRVITAGRIIKAKGQWHLLKAFKLVLQSFPETKLVILGTGELIQDLKDFTKNLQIEDSVEFKGFIEKPEDDMQQSDIYVSSSLWEGFGNVITEAMYCGLPVISTDCPGGPHEIVDPKGKVGEVKHKYEISEYGILTPAFSMQDFDGSIDINEEEKIMAEAICRLIDDDELRTKLKRAGYKRADDFTIDKITTQWDELIRSIS